jgi:outer membrane protein assembly factor BamB
MPHFSSAPLRLCVTLVFFVFPAVLATANDNWPQWRGPNGNGTSDSKNLPITWNLQTGENIAWKTELPAWSGSTPVIWGDYIFITSPGKDDGTPPPADERGKGPPGGFGGKGGFDGKGFGDKGKDGKGPPPGFGGGGGGRGGSANKPAGPGGQSLLVICLSKKDGSVRWQKELDRGNRVYNKQNSSSPSPVTDGKHVWVVTGNGVVTALDFDGNELWKKNLQEQYGKFGLNWGYGSSPLLFDGKVIIEVLHGMRTDDPSYLVAFEGNSGKVVWRQERPTDAPNESPDSYSTPALATVDGKPQIVVSGGDYVTGHDPKTGQELWRAGGLNPNRNGNFRSVNSPVVADGIVYAGTRVKPVLALRIGGEGDVTEKNLVWRWNEDGGPDVPTPVTDGKYYYMVADGGIITVIDAKTGKEIYQHRLGVGSTIDASPLLADGKLYITGENSATVILAAGPEYKELARNELDGSWTMSSIAVSGQQLFIRTGTHLYCIGNKAAN